MYALVDGKPVLISFKGGTLRPPINGTFSTSDLKLQDALAKDTSNGISFKEIGSFDDESTTMEAEATPGTSVTGIKTVQEARDYLVDNVENTTKSSLPNATAVLALAEKHFIVFPDLNIK